MLADDEYADAIVAQGLPEPVERVSEWSAEREALARIEDQLRSLVAVSIAAAGGKPGPVHPSRRPVTALDAARDRDKQHRYDQLLARIFGQSTDRNR